MPQSQTQPTPDTKRERKKWQKQLVQNKQTHVREVERTAPSSPSEVITMLKWMTKHEDGQWHKPPGGCGGGGELWGRLKIFLTVDKLHPGYPISLSRFLTKHHVQAFRSYKCLRNKVSLSVNWSKVNLGSSLEQNWKHLSDESYIPSFNEIHYLVLKKKRFN